MSSIITPTQLQTEIRNSKARFTVIDNQSGQVFTSEVEPKKLTPTNIRIMGKKDNSFDGHGKQESINSKWFVDSPSAPFKNGWAQSLIHPKESEHSFLVTVWTMALEFSFEEGLVKCGGEIRSTPHGEYFSVEIKGNNMKAFYNKDFKLRFFEIVENGNKEEIWV